MGLDLGDIWQLRGPPDSKVAELAARQHGVVSVDQLRTLGFDLAAIQHRLAVGRLHRVHRGVYAVGHSYLDRSGRWMAAVLACGAGALLGDRSAATLWGLLPGDGVATHVSVADRRGRKIRGVIRHRPRRVHPEDRAACQGIPVTSVARTLLDLAATTRHEQFRRAFEEADRLRLLDFAALHRLLDRTVGHHGRGRLRSLVAFAFPPPEVRSELERRFLGLCEAADLPPPAVNAPVAGHEVDMLWRRQRLVVELDGFAYHRSRAAFEQDRTRDADLQLAGFRVLRLTARRLQDEPAAVVDAVRTLLERPPRLGGPP